MCGTPPGRPLHPQATLAQTDPASNATVLGVTHRYAPPGRNGTAAPAGLALNTLPYMMHYVTLAVEPGHEYVKFRQCFLYFALIFTVLSWMCVGIHRRRMPPSPVCA